MLVAKSSPLKVFDLCSKALVPTFSVVLLEPVCYPSTIRPSLFSSARLTRVDLAKIETQSATQGI